MEYILIIIAAIFVNNIVLAQFLGICPFVGVSGKVSTSVGMSGAAFCNDPGNHSNLVDPKLYPYSFWNRFPANHQLYPCDCFAGANGGDLLKKVSPPLYQALGVFLPLITTNCAVLGVAILTIQKEFTSWKEWFLPLPMQLVLHSLCQYP